MSEHRNQSHISMRAGMYDGDMALYALNRQLRKEFSIYTNYANRYKPYNGFKQRMNSNEILSPDEAALVASIESAAINFMMVPLQLRHEEAVAKPERTAAFYRQLTYLKARGVLDERSLNGSKLLLGAGSIIADAVPLTTEIEELDAERLFNYILSGPPPEADNEEVAKHIEDMLSKTVKTKKRPGAITAVDFDSDLLDYGRALTSASGLNVDIREDEVLDFLAQDTNNYDFIGIIRLDPSIVKRNPGLVKSKLSPLIKDRLSDNGTVLATIGGGNSQDEFKERQYIMKLLSGNLREMNPHVFRNKDEEATHEWDDGAYMDLETLVASKTP